MSEKDGGPAFPQFQKERVYHGSGDRFGEDTFVPVDGMALRDWFAGQAIVGALMEVRVPGWNGDGIGDRGRGEASALAAAAYVIADAMLAERAK